MERKCKNCMYSKKDCYSHRIICKNILSDYHNDEVETIDDDYCTAFEEVANYDKQTNY